jgi:hypothetical protein
MVNTDFPDIGQRILTSLGRALFNTHNTEHAMVYTIVSLGKIENPSAGITIDQAVDALEKQAKLTFGNLLKELAKINQFPK